MTKNESVVMFGDFTTKLVAATVSIKESSEPEDAELVMLTSVMCVVMAGLTGQSPTAIRALFATASLEALKYMVVEGDQGGSDVRPS